MTDAPDTLSQPSQPPQPSGPAGAKVHDLGYQPYRGPRKPQSTRHRIIARKAVSSAWRGWWRMKLWIIGVGVTLFVISVVMYVSEGVSSLMRGGIKLSLTDALLPMSIQFFQLSAIAMTLTVGAITVANDLRTGAFEFYFSRPVRARDYVLGKVLGLTIIMGIPLFLGPLILTLVRLGLSGTDDVLHHLHLGPRAALIGLLASLAYAIVPLAFSALSSQKRHTLPAFAAFFFLTPAIVALIESRAGVEWIEMLDMRKSVVSLAYALYDVQPIGGSRPATWIPVTGLLGYIVLGLGFLYWRVSSAEKQGMGGR